MALGPLKVRTWIPSKIFGLRWRQVYRTGNISQETETNCGKLFNKYGTTSICLTQTLQRPDSSSRTSHPLLIFSFWVKNKRKHHCVTFFVLLIFTAWKNIISMSCHWYNTKPQKCDFYFSTFCWRKFAVWLIINAELFFWYEYFGNWISYPMIYNNN